MDVHRATDAVLLGIDEIAKNAAVGAVRHHDQLHRGGRRGVPVARRPGDALRAAGRATRSRRSSRARSASSRCSGRRCCRSPRIAARIWRARGALRGMGRPPHPQARARRPRAAPGGRARSRRCSPGTISSPPRARRAASSGSGGAAPTSRELFPDVPKELMHDHDHGHDVDHDHGHDHDTPRHSHGPHRPTHARAHPHDEDEPSSP